MTATLSPDSRRRGARVAPIAIASALATCGCSPPGSPEPTATETSADAGPAWFENVAAAAGVSYVYRSGQAGALYLPETVGGGAALFDMDGDGDLDLYLVQGGSVGNPASNPPNQLFRNNGDGTFEDVSAGSGTGDRTFGMGAAAGDYDNDGDVDLYVTNLGANLLYRNDGGGRFTDVTADAGAGDGAWGASAAFADYDLDGDLDLYVCNYVNWSVAIERTCFNAMGAPDYCAPANYDAPARDVLYRNDGDGTFTDVTEDAGLTVGFGNGLGVLWGDFDGDGRPDAFVANDGMPDQLWSNLGDGRFRDVALLAGCALDHEGKAKAGMGVTAADIDDDGDLDMMVCNLGGESDSVFLNAGSYFQDLTAQSGLRQASRPYTRFGLGWLDFDNDGFLDLYQANGRVITQDESWSDDPYAEPNLVFRGEQGGRFRELLPRGGTAQLLLHTSRAAAFGDLDSDGGVDIVVVNRDGELYILRNVVPDRGHWVLLQVVDERGRDAIGSTVTLQLAGRTITRDVRAGYSYLASNDPRVHVGLGAETAARAVSVRWIDGTIESFGDLDADRIHVLRRGDGAATP
ncbi:MAG: CRTAC1 family protein [Planctomycetota bacterium]|jgi:hypothetical protein